MTKYDATLRVKRHLAFKTHEEISKMIGITRPTLNARLKRNNWKLSELYLIQTKL
jgi:DNA-binding Lrp family transcriptional regulator